MKNHMKKLLYIFALTLFIKVGAQVPSNVPTNGLMGYWPFTGNANDISGSGYNGTVFGAQLSADRFNNAASSYSFNGISDYILTSYQGILGSNSRAVSFWAKTTETLNVITGVSWGTNSSANRFNCGFNYSGNGPTIGIANGAITYSTNSPLSNNQWHHYVFQFGGTTLNQVEVYQDAVLLTQTLSTFNPSSLLNTLAGFNVQFGRINYSPSPDYFKGQLDDIGIWNRVLSNCEILALYNGILNITANGPTTFCQGNNVVLTASSANSYSWSNGAITQSITVNTSGSYSVAITSGTCTQTPPSVSVTVNTIPSINISSNANIICTGQSATLTATGANTYSWNTNSGSTSIVITPTANTTYSVTGTNTNNCAGSAAFTQSISSCASLNENNQSLIVEFAMFPNPAKESVKFHSNENIVIELFDLLGSKLSELNSMQTLDCTDFAKGVYLIRAKNRTGNYTAKLLIIE